MEEQSVSYLEEMGERRAQRFLAEMLGHLSAEEVYEIRHRDYVMERPQSGERVRDREKMR